MRELKGKNDVKSKHKLDKVIEAIAEKAESNYNKVMEELKAMKPDGGEIKKKHLSKFRFKM